VIENYLKDLMAIPRQKIDNSDLLNGIDRVTEKLAECINLAQTTLDNYGIPYVKKNFTTTRSHNPQSDDIFVHLYRVNNTVTPYVLITLIRIN